MSVYFVIYFNHWCTITYNSQRIKQPTAIAKNVKAIQFQILFIKLNLENTLHITFHALYITFSTYVYTLFMCICVCIARDRKNIFN